MKTIFHIARSELKMMFYSPIAWLILIVFTVVSGLMYFDSVASLAEISTIMDGNFLTNATNLLFSNEMFGGLFFRIKGYIYMFVPLLTMGLVSQELSSGSIKLLNSSPVTNTQIILGKFLTMAIYGIAMIAVLFLMAVFGAANITHFDWPSVGSGLLGLYLLFITYAAIGIFMSSLTSYQVVATICTFALFALLDFVGDFGQSVLWLRDITFWLSISGRVEEMLLGMISSQDVFYFLIITAAFLTLTVLRLSNKRRARSLLARWAGYLGVVAAAIGLGLVLSLPKLIFFKDTTSNERLTITPNSRQIMRNVDGKVEVTYYLNVLDRTFGFGNPRNDNYTKKQLWMPYLRYKPDIKFKYVYYWYPTEDASMEERFPDLNWEQRAARIAEINDMRIDRIKTPEEIDRIIDLSDEAYRYVMHIKLKNGGSTFLRIYDDNNPYPNEKEMSAGFKRLTQGPVSIGFLTGHGERSISNENEQGYHTFANNKKFRYALVNQGFDAVPVNLSDSCGIPSHINILVISDLREELSPLERAEILKYIDDGGNLILACEPGRQEYANTIAEELGVTFMDGQVVNPYSEDLSQNVMMAQCTPELIELVPAIGKILETNPDARTSMPGAVAIDFTPVGGFTAKPLIMSDSLTWINHGYVNFAEETATPDPAEKVGPTPLAMGLERTNAASGRTQKILVMGDADWISNGELQRGRMSFTAINFNVITEMFSWLSDYEYPIDDSRPDVADKGFNVDVDKEKVWRWIYVGLLPLLMLGTAVVIIIRRKSR